MDAENTKGKNEFIIDHIWWAFVSWIWYKSILFRCLGKHSFKESRMILLAMVLSCCILGIALEMEKQRNYVSVLMNLLAGFGMYAVLTYFPIKRNLILITFFVAGIFVVANSFLILCQRIKNRNKLKKILTRRIRRVCFTSRNILCMGLAVVMFLIGINIVFDTSIIKPSVVSAKQSNSNDQTIANNIDTLVLLYEDTWETLPVEKKLDVLQTVANVEQRFLGLPNELNVGVANLREGLVGCYSDNDHEIIVSVDSLLNDSSFELTDTIAHEAYHSLQHRMVDAYDEASEDMKQLIFYYDASIYKREFAYYTDGFKDFYGYYSQECESDARQYARSAANEYFERIYEYLGVNKQVVR